MIDALRVDVYVVFFFFQAEDGIRDLTVTGVQTCALPISAPGRSWATGSPGTGSRWPAAGSTCGTATPTGSTRTWENSAALWSGSTPHRRRSGERRGGKECRSRGAAYHLKKNKSRVFTIPA